MGAGAPESRRAIGILTPQVGGFYFGALIAGATRAAAAAGYRILAVQTFPTQPGRERPGEPLPGTPCSLDAVDGLLVVGGGLLPYQQTHVLQRLEHVVLVGTDQAGGAAPVILSDNHGGARTATEHLLSHGHRQIGFVGDLSQRDIRERFEGYRATLVEHGITVERDWFFETSGNHEPGGAEAGGRFLAAGRPTTAVIVATDRNAVGFTRALRAAGLLLPRDQAVIGFDHTESGSRLVPRLSTVNPHHDRVGELAVQKLVERIGGYDVSEGPHRVTASLVARESCGCNAVSTIGGSPSAEAALHDSDLSEGRAALRRLSLTGFAGPLSMSPSVLVHDDPHAAWVRAVVEPLEVAVDRASEPSALALGRLNDLTAAMQPHPDTLEQAVAAVREIEMELAERVPAHAKALSTLHRATTDVLLALSRGCLRPLLGRHGHLERTVEDQYEVDMHMVPDKGGSPRMLTWVPRSLPGPACLGMWVGTERAGRDREIEIVGVRGRSGTLGRLIGQRMPASEFPPQALTRGEPMGRTDLTFVVPVTSPDNDWGLLVLTGRVDSQLTSSHNRYHHWASRLAGALDHEKLLTTLRERERALRLEVSSDDRAAAAAKVHEERHDLWAQAVRHGTWDWDVNSGTVYYSPQWKQVLGFEEDDEVGSSPADWLDRVHPDDRHGLSALIAAQLGGAQQPLACEHRVRTASGEYRWMMCRAVTVLDDAGCPSRLVGALVDMTERKEQEQALSRGTLRDSETGAANFLLFLDRLEVAVERARASQDADSTLVLVRLLPAPVGGDDRAPSTAEQRASVIRVLQQATLDGDGAARLGEDDMAVVLGGHDCEPDRLATLVTRLRSMGEVRLAVGVAESLRSYDDAGDALRAAGLALQRDQSELERRQLAPRS